MKTKSTPWSSLILGLIAVASLGAVLQRAMERERYDSEMVASASTAERDSQQLARQIEEAIKQKWLVVGMTEGEVQRAWGAPTSVNSHQYSWGREAQWVWDREYGSDRYAYFKNGVMTSFSF